MVAVVVAIFAVVAHVAVACLAALPVVVAAVQFVAVVAAECLASAVLVVAVVVFEVVMIAAVVATLAHIYHHIRVNDVFPEVVVRENTSVVAPVVFVVVEATGIYVDVVRDVALVAVSRDEQCYDDDTLRVLASSVFHYRVSHYAFAEIHCDDLDFWVDSLASRGN